jgi:phosphate transport system substrate-binding protein
MSKISTSVLLLVILVSMACRSGKQETSQEIIQPADGDAISGNFSISGAFALYPLAIKWADDFMKINPGVTITVQRTGTGQGISDLIAGKSQIAMISRPLTDEEITSGIHVVPVAKDGVAPIVSQSNPFLNILMNRGMSTDEFIRTFTGERPVTWGELTGTESKDKVAVYKRLDESGAADIWAEFLYRKSSDLKGTEVDGDEEMVRAVTDNPLAIGFCNFSYAFNTITGEKLPGIQIVPFDLDFDNSVDTKEMPFSTLEKAQRSVWLGAYPRNLCRELTFGTLGKPADRKIAEFLKYVLTEGQKDVKAAGLCELNNVYIRYYLDLIK